MKIRIGTLILPLNILILVLVVTVIPSDVWRVILGLPFLLFFPGYVLLLAVFPGKEGIKNFERMVLSFGFSIVAVVVLGFTLNYVWVINTESILYAILAFMSVMSIIAWIRRNRLPREDRLSFEFNLRLSYLGGTVWDKVLSIVLVIVILTTLGIGAYSLCRPKLGEKFTEFYLLGPEWIAADYPSELVIGDTARVTIGIINREQQAVSYSVRVLLGGEQIEELGPVILEHEQKWEHEVNIVPRIIGKNERVEFLLFKDGEEDPSSLHFWLDVKEKT